MRERHLLVQLIVERLQNPGRMEPVMSVSVEGTYTREKAAEE
jgi:hypothetical protein